MFECHSRSNSLRKDFRLVLRGIPSIVRDKVPCHHVTKSKEFAAEDCDRGGMTSQNLLIEMYMSLKTSSAFARAEKREIIGDDDDYEMMD